MVYNPLKKAAKQQLSMKTLNIIRNNGKAWIAYLLCAGYLASSLFMGTLSAGAYTPPEQDASAYTFYDDFERPSGEGNDPLINGWDYGVPGRKNGGYGAGNAPAVRLESNQLILDNTGVPDFLRTRITRPQSEARLNQSVSIEYTYADNNRPMLFLRVQDNKNTTSINNGTETLKHLTGYGMQLWPGSSIRFYKFNNLGTQSLPVTAGNWNPDNTAQFMYEHQGNNGKYINVGSKVRLTFQVEETSEGTKLTAVYYLIDANGAVIDTGISEVSHTDTTKPINTPGTAGVAVCRVDTGGSGASKPLRELQPIDSFSYTGFGSSDTPEGNNKMLRISANGNTSVAGRINGASYFLQGDAGTTYRCSFDYKTLSGRPAVFKASRLHNGLYSDMTLKDITDYNSGRLQKTYEFTLPEGTEATARNLALIFDQTGIAAGGTVDIANLKLWTSEDETETNLLSNGDFTKAVPFSSYYAGLFKAGDNNWGVEYGSACPDLELIDVPDDWFVKQVPSGSKMVHIVDNISQNNTTFGQAIELTEGKTYILSFYYKFETGAFNSSAVLRVKNAWWNGPNYHGSNGGTVSTMKLAYEDRKVNYSEYTFTVTDVSAGTRFVGFEFEASQQTDLYLYNFKLVDADRPDVNCFSNGDFNDGLGGWRYGSNVGGPDSVTVESGYANGYAEVVPYDESLFEKRDTVSRMMYIKKTDTKNTAFGQNVALENGKTYKISYYYKYNEGGINTSVNFRIKAALGSGVYTTYYSYNETGSKAMQLHEDKDWLYSEYTFTFTGADGIYAVCFEFFSATQMYLYDMSVVDSSSPDVNLLVNATVSDDLFGWRSDWSTAGKLDEFTPDSSFSVKALAYIESIFKRPPPYSGPEQMLYVQNNSSAFKQLLQRVPLKAENTYYYSVYVASSIQYYCMVHHTGAREIVFNNLAPIEKEDFGDYYKLTFKFTLPSTVKGEPLDTSNIFVGIQFPGGTFGYVFKPSLWDADDKEKKNLFVNSSFEEGLNYWAFSWGPWFIPGSAGLGLTQYQDDVCSLQVMDYDESKFVTYLNDGRYSNNEWASHFVYNGSKQGDSGTIKGSLINEKNEGIAGRKMSLESNSDSLSATTGTKGQFEFKDIPTGFYELFMLDKKGDKLPCNYTVVIQKGYVVTVTVTYDGSSSTSEIIDEKEEENEEEEEISGIGIVRGWLFDTDKNPMRETTLYLRDVGSATTNNDGYFEFVDVPPGDYEIYMLRDNGSEFVFRTVTAKSGKAIEIKLTNKGNETVTDKIIEERKVGYWVYIVIGIAVVLIGCATVFIVLHKKKKSLVTKEHE